MANIIAAISVLIVPILTIGAIISLTAKTYVTWQQIWNKLRQDMSRMKNDIEDIRQQLADIVSKSG